MSPKCLICDGTMPIPYGLHRLSESSCYAVEINGAKFAICQQCFDKIPQTLIQPLEQGGCLISQAILSRRQESGFLPIGKLGVITKANLVKILATAEATI
ncbi:MAG: hypothetical protein RB292_05110 [Patescibacteria group bacterium]|jgi:hypothetical protein|nr:hypothetical protein [Patescibacteria group bacterium]